MGTKRTTAGLLASLGAVVAIAGTHGPAEAQELRAGWQPYLGCWQSMSAEGDQGVLCLVADGQDVEMLTIVGGAVEFSEPLVADGGTHEFERDDCQGTESARFSEDGRRLYTASAVTCDGEAPRRSTGIISMLAHGEWADVRAITTNGASTMWSQKYQRTSNSVLNELGLAVTRARPNPFALRGGMTSAMAAITIDDVIDASRNVDTDAVQAWLAAAEQQFEGLRAEDLIRMEEAGVATAVIDVVVAVSFPEHFALNQESNRTRAAYGSRMYMDPFYYGYGSYGYGSYGYGSYGYGSYGRRYYGGWYPGYYTPVVVSVNRIPSGGGGRAVAGKGYRAPRSPASSSSGASVSGSSGGSKSTTRTSTGRKAVRRGGK